MLPLFNEQPRRTPAADRTIRRNIARITPISLYPLHFQFLPPARIHCMPRSTCPRVIFTRTIPDAIGSLRKPKKRSRKSRAHRAHGVLGSRVVLQSNSRRLGDGTMAREAAPGSAGRASDLERPNARIESRNVKQFRRLISISN